MAKLATLQKLQPLQNGQLWPKIKIAKNMQKNDSRSTLQLIYAKRKKKNSFKKTVNILKISKLCKVAKLPFCKGCNHIAKATAFGKIVALGLNLKFPKTCERQL